MNTQRKAVANDAVLRVRSEHRLRRAVRQTSTVIVHELGVSYGEHRVDIATVNRRFLSGFEIKSEADTLTRLPKQQQAFSAVFDRMTLVVVPKHLNAAKDIVPEWWAITVDDGTSYHIERVGRQNNCISPLGCLKLLWKSELAVFVKNLFFRNDVLALRKADLQELLLQEVGPLEIQRYVRKTLWQRLSTRTAEQSRSGDDLSKPATKKLDFQCSYYFS